MKRKLSSVAEDNRASFYCFKEFFFVSRHLSLLSIYIWKKYPHRHTPCPMPSYLLFLILYPYPTPKVPKRTHLVFYLPKKRWLENIPDHLQLDWRLFFLGEVTWKKFFTAWAKLLFMDRSESSFFGPRRARGTTLPVNPTCQDRGIAYTR